MPGRIEPAAAGRRGLKLRFVASHTAAERLTTRRQREQHDALFQLVDHFVTPEMIDAVAREADKGRWLIVATTDLDKHETVLWNLGEIAQHCGSAARTLFRDVLIASASVPGVFAPVLIHVRDGRREYDEMHVDGGVTTSVFSTPLVVGVQSAELPLLRGAHLYMIVNGQLARTPQTTRYNTIDIMSNAFAAELTYKTREAIVDNIAAAHRLGMTFNLTEIPVDYPQASFIDFDRQHMQALFDYAAECATRGLLWLTPTQSIRRNMNAYHMAGSTPRGCPASTAEPAH